MNPLVDLKIFTPTDIPEILNNLQTQIGTDDSILPQILSTLKQVYSLTNNFDQLIPHFYLLLLEDQPISTDCINFLQPLLDYTNHPFFILLLNSPYYRHRLVLTHFKITDQTILRKLLSDEITIVAEHTASSLSKLITPPFTPEELCSLAKQFCSNVYLHSHAIDLLQLIAEPTEEAIIMLSEIASAPAWRVRLRLVRRMSMLTQYSLDKLFILLSEDKEEQIRVELVKNLQYLRDIEIIKKMVTRFEKEQSIPMRVAWIEQVGILMSLHNLDGSNYLRNSCDDSRVQVRIATLGALKRVQGVITNELFSQLLKELINSFEGTKYWRVRYTLIETIGELASQDEESNYMVQVFFKNFYDPVAEVRNLTSNVFGIIARRFGKNWAINNLKEIYKILESKKYVHRVSVVGVVEVYCQLISEEDSLNEQVEELIRRINNDPIVNVRYALIDVIKGYSKRFIGVISDMSLSEDSLLKTEAIRILNSASW